MGIIRAIHKCFDYEKMEGYRIVLLDTHPRYDIRAPDNLFIQDLDYLKLIEEFERHRAAKFRYYFKRGRIFLPIPIYFENNWNLADKIVDSLHQAALRRLRDVAGTRIDIYIHEHSVCVRSAKCLWRQFVDLINTADRKRFNYRVHIVKTNTIFLNSCKKIENDREYYTRPKEFWVSKLNKILYYILTTVFFFVLTKEAVIKDRKTIQAPGKSALSRI